MLDDSQLKDRLTQAAANGPAALAQACAHELAAGRGIDAPGAARAVATDAGLSRLLAVGAPVTELAACLAALATAARCLGCGSCCRVSSPTLYQEDALRLEAAGLGWRDLYTLRPGEQAFSARLGRLEALDAELIKLREEHGACAQLTAKGCAMYEHRPLQCRWLECWSGRHAGQLEDRPRLSRADLLAGDDTALALAQEYEVKVPAEELHAALAAASAGEPSGTEQALALMERDHRLRAGISARYGYGPEALPLILGRSAVEVAANYGLELVVEGDRPVLRKVN